MIDFIISYLPALLLSFILTYISIPPIIRVSKAKDLFDEPNHRKLNKVVIPTLGGIGIFIGISLSFIIFQKQQHAPELSYLFGATLMLFFIGLKDDILIISAQKKLMVQLAATAMIVFLGDLHVTNLNGLFGLESIPAWIGAPLSFGVILFLINAMNLIDGIDGLAAGITILASFIIGGWFFNQGFYPYAILAFSLAGSLLAFLRFNLWGGENKIFMGDTGSLVIGAIIAVLVIKFNNAGSELSHLTSFSNFTSIALALLIVPICDVIRVFTIRIYQGRSPFSPDMNHIHHLLIKLGMSHKHASSFLITYTALFFMLAVGTQHLISPTLSFFGLLLLSFSAVGILAKLHKFQQAKKAALAKQVQRKIMLGLKPEEKNLIELVQRSRFLFFRKRA